MDLTLLDFLLCKTPIALSPDDEKTGMVPVKGGDFGDENFAGGQLRSVDRYSNKRKYLLCRACGDRVSHQQMVIIRIDPKHPRLAVERL